MSGNVIDRWARRGDVLPRLAAAAALALAAFALCAAGAAAATIEVGTTADSLVGGGCSLRAAIASANHDAPVDGCVAGAGAGTTTVDGAGLDRVFAIGAGRSKTTRAKVTLRR
jgi:hypothetical protein